MNNFLCEVTSYLFLLTFFFHILFCRGRTFNCPRINGTPTHSMINCINILTNVESIRGQLYNPYIKVFTNNYIQYISNKTAADNIKLNKMSTPSFYSNV